MKIKSYAIIATHKSSKKLVTYYYKDGTMYLSNKWVTLFSSAKVKCFWSIEHLFDREWKRGKRRGIFKGYLTKAKEAFSDNYEGFRVVRINSKDCPIQVDWERHHRNRKRYENTDRYTNQSGKYLHWASVFRCRGR